MASPAFAPPDVKDVTLALFAGRKTDITPSDIPEGLTPDEQDGCYLPGGWFSRPGLARLYATGALTAGAQVLYEKTYVQPNDDPLTLVLTSDGKLWVEDVGNDPDSPSSIFSVAPGLYAQSVSEFGREYIAFSDLLHGQGVPLQYDGTYLDRVTMDGPGAGPAAADYISSLAVHGILTVGGPAQFFEIAAASTGATQTGNIVTITTTLAHDFIPGQAVFITGVGVAGYNGLQIVQTVPTSTTFTYALNVSGLAASGSGIAGNAVCNILTNIPKASAQPQINVGDSIVLTETGSGLDNGTAIALSGDVDTDASGTIVSYASGNTFPPGLAGQPITIDGIQATVAEVASPTTLTLTSPITANLSGVAYSSSLPNPATWPVVEVWQGATYWEIAFSFGAAPSTVTVTDPGVAGNVSLGGQSSPGVHQLVCMFLTRQGFITQPSPAVRFVSAGNSQWEVTDLPLGPENVVARVLGFTGAGGDNFFIIPASVTLPNVTSPIPTPIVVGATVIPDNSSTSFIFDVPDNTLLAAVPIDQIGNDLFDQVVLGPVLGFFAYASRLNCWGDYNKVENFLNLGFCGGYLSGGLTAPLGWDSGSNAGGTLVNGGSWASGMSWQITGDGSGSQKGLLSQSAYQDSFGDAIISPSTYYSVRLWAKASAAGLAGNYFIVLSSASASFTATAEIAIDTFSTEGAMTALAAFNAETPATIPDDLMLTIYEIGLDDGATITVSEHEIIFTENPYRDNESRWSYVDNPEAFAETTGQLGPSDDDSPIRCFALLRESSLLETAEGIHIFEDNAGEPDTWNVNSLTRAIGSTSLRGGDPGKFGTGDAAEDWAVVAGKNGVYLFAGAQFWKVSQEISRGTLPQSQDPRKCWDDINWAAAQTMVAKNDPAARRAYFAVPINGATTPNVVFALDYREMDTATQIAQAPPLHITIQGKMKSSDLTRKWSVWNIAANDIEILERPGNQRQVFFAGGAFPGGESYGNIYSLSPTKLTDDDYGQIYPYYTTYAFTDHDQEQALGLGADSKLVKQVHGFITGVGQVIITPIIDSLYNFLPSLSPRILVADTDQSNFLKSDLEWVTQIRGDRIFFRVSVLPLPGATDVQIRLQKFIVHMMKDPIAQFRQSGI